MYRTMRLKTVIVRLLGGAAFLLVLLLCAATAAGSLSAAEEHVEESVRLPIIMYHGLLKEEKRQGKFVISPADFEADLQYLKENGYHTVVLQDVINYVKEGTPLPEKPVMLTFDDGYYNNYLYAFPLLRQYESKIVLSPIGRYADEYSQKDRDHANYSHATWEELDEMVRSGLVEVQNHSYNLHQNGQRRGAQRMSGESAEQYRSMLVRDVEKMQQAVQENIGWTPTAFTYPFGAVSRESLSILKEMGFQATLICEAKINTITRDPDCLYGLGRYLRPAGIGSEACLGKILEKAQ
ncbi:MAG: polysaccharide deacetylase family protein [Clostridiales bacterium]|nr:polysaccharide deacetylase family protein [Clostridiales bacterium]